MSNKKSMHQTALRLLQGQAEFDKLRLSLQKYGIHCELSFSMVMLESAVDLLGVPRESDVFCRDSVYSEWDECNRNPERYIALIKKYYTCEDQQLC